jgi:hypothetical protein
VVSDPLVDKAGVAVARPGLMCGRGSPSGQWVHRMIARLTVSLRAAAVIGRDQSGGDEGPMSVVEYIPADRASTSLVIEDQFSNLRGESFSLPLSFPDACRLCLTGGHREDGPNRVRRSTQIVSCHVCGIRRESSSSCVTHAHLAADPRATDIDDVARSGVAAPCRKRCRTCSAHRAAHSASSR